ncbi:UDP-2,3-diacylglucosamine diphosphatase [Pseudobythopirellula maris]|uniref:UDP-2,3-diacylglucosamine diphosphatase n=1 Tax=Pseudobythopirellula maris TaxID=2527991 RepID=UPI0018D37D49|nr:UDP-2,3-diacylglucosamine diphosphatase [Pseudobythopirellula maris]
MSDVHLGCKHSQAVAFLELLERHEPEQLYIVGDFIDGWKLKRRWRWLPVYDQIMLRLMAMKRRGTRLLYTPGNHDDFLRSFLSNFGVIDIKDRFVHAAADGRRYLITHGDQFDRVEQSCQWLSLVASYAYDVLLTANWLGNKLRGKNHDPYAFCGAIKRRVKRLVSHVSEFEGQLVASAKDTGCDGVICGHIHHPRILQVEGLSYLNTGDWVENCTALLEYDDGSFELVRSDGTLLDRLAPCPPSGAIPDLRGDEDEHAESLAGLPASGSLIS